MKRRAAVAGYFYPRDPEALTSQLSRLVLPDKRRPKAIAVVSPHAGYEYSGAVAGAVFSSVELPGTYVILAPSHRPIRPVFAVMTERWTTAEAFRHWHYTSDPTHIAFYHARTLAHIACDRALVPVYDDGCRVAIFRRVLG